MSIKNLGHVLTIHQMHFAREFAMHVDVDAFGAPSECHALVSKHEAKRERLARRHAEAIARAPMRVIMREAKRRGFVERRHGLRLHDACLSRVLPSWER